MQKYCWKVNDFMSCYHCLEWRTTEIYGCTLLLTALCSTGDLLLVVSLCDIGGCTCDLDQCWWTVDGMIGRGLKARLTLRMYSGMQGSIKVNDCGFLVHKKEDPRVLPLMFMSAKDTSWRWSGHRSTAAWHELKLSCGIPLRTICNTQENRQINWQIKMEGKFIVNNLSKFQDSFFFHFVVLSQYCKISYLLRLIKV